VVTVEGIEQSVNGQHEIERRSNAQNAMAIKTFEIYLTGARKFLNGQPGNEKTGNHKKYVNSQPAAFTDQTFETTDSMKCQDTKNRKSAQTVNSRYIAAFYG
jgi:hypothetical protein